MAKLSETNMKTSVEDLVSNISKERDYHFAEFQNVNQSQHICKRLSTLITSLLFVFDN